MLYDFNVCYGYLLHKQVEVVKNSLFLDGLGNRYDVKSEGFLFRTMLVHCFMYYLSFRESTDEDFLNERNYILIPASNVGIATYDGIIHVGLDSVDVEISTPSIDQIDAKWSEDTGLFTYSPFSGVILNYEEGELRQFIHDQQKVIDIYFNISLSINIPDDHNVGVILIRNN